MKNRKGFTLLFTIFLVLAFTIPVFAERAENDDSSIYAGYYTPKHIDSSGGNGGSTDSGNSSSVVVKPPVTVTQEWTAHDILEDDLLNASPYNIIKNASSKTVTAVYGAKNGNGNGGIAGTSGVNVQGDTNNGKGIGGGVIKATVPAETQITKAWTEKIMDAYKETNTHYYYTIHHPGTKITFTYKYIKNAWKNNFSNPDHLVWTVDGPAGGVASTNFNGPINTTAKIRFSKTGDYTVTATPYIMWDEYDETQWTATMTETGTYATDTTASKIYTTSIYSSTSGGLDPSKASVFKLKITAQDLNMDIPVTHMDTTTNVDAEPIMVQ